MPTPSFKEDHISQIPALQLLQKLGYTYLSREQALELRGGKESNVLLEGILRAQLPKINRIRVSSSKTAEFSETNIENGIRALKELPLHEGYITAAKTAYDLLTLGKPLEQNVDGTKKSHTLQYIDWKDISKNVFHVTEEFSVLRTDGKERFRPDIVLFVNGIPLCVIECKRPDLKDALAQAISQHNRNQQEDGIRPLYLYSQLLLSIATTLAKYATTDTKEKFWATWKEETPNALAAKMERDKLHQLINTPSSREEKREMYAARKQWEVKILEMREKEVLSISVQDEYLYSLCRPQRLLELTKDYILFEGGNYKKIARYQQYFAVKKIIERVQNLDKGKRNGGVIWHTQGSGKSLTMAMVAQKIRQVVSNPKIIIVTDRVDLDTQICNTFRRVSEEVEKAHSGKKLAALLQSPSSAVITTIINKFESAVTHLGDAVLPSADIFVLIDEGHRTQYGTFNVKMQKALPNACFLAFTGTPLMKKEKSTAQKFGGIIDAYTILQAVEDGAIVPILYEGRHALQDVNQKALDRGFDKVSEGLDEYQKEELKKKYSQADLIKKTDQRIDEIAKDISAHFRKNWKDTGFKGMVVTPDKATAIRYKEAFDLEGKISTEVIMSAPDMREGTDDIHEETHDRVVAFWKKAIVKYGKDFDQELIKAFKDTDSPELMIVIDKLLTGFDSPRVIVMYVCRKLREHTLLQAIARVNRVAADKEYGFIIDYEGIIGELDAAMNTYTQLSAFDAEEVAGTLTDIKKILEMLPQAHSELSDIFKALPNKFDISSYCDLLADEEVRELFYTKYRVFGKYLKIATASIEYEQKETAQNKDLYLKALKFYTQLRTTVANVYSDGIDFKMYEKQLQRLLDQHVITEEIISITNPVSILDTEAFQKELERVIGVKAKAEMIASKTNKYLAEKMNEDPVHYKKLSELIQQTIEDLRNMRISEAEAFEKLKAYMEESIQGKKKDIPEVLHSNENTFAFFRLAKEYESLNLEHCIAFAQKADEIIRKYIVIDWATKPDILRRILFYLGEFLIDECGMETKEADILAEKCLDIAKSKIW